MRLLILGGSGFVSGHLTDQALQAGHEVWIVTRGQKPVCADVHTITVDRNDAPRFTEALEASGQHWDAVLDCICYNSEQADFDLSVIGRFTDRIIVISTDSVYHPRHKTVPQNEEAPVYLEDGGYGANKRKMEEAFLKNAPSHIHWTIFRPGHIFGEGSELGCYPEQGRQKDLLAQLRSRSPMRLVGGGTYLLHPVYVGDLVRVMLDCIGNEYTWNQIFCIGGPEIITNRHYYEILGKILQLPVSFETIPEEGYLEAHPAYSGHLCNRAYTLDKLAGTGIRLPDTPIVVGLQRQVQHLIGLGR